ncbi:MAG: ComEA family DNA-binding protein, partial [Solirubrobacterales bacterium]|nr:ComEA family DNA-binding protein [Solirubrobacterales bacterium]
MGELSRRQLIGYLVAGAVIVVLGALWARGGASGGGGGSAARGSTLQLSGVPGDAGGGASGDAGSSGASAGAGAGAGGSDGGAGAGASVVVHVAGAVRRPGLYTLPVDARVEAAIGRAGGARRNANLDAINLAAKVTDGRQILVPAKVAAPSGAGGGSGGGTTSAAGSAGG